MNTTIHTDILRQVESILAQAGIHDPAGDAHAIVVTASRQTSIANQAMCALAMAAERAAGAPLGYVTGSVHFMGVEMLTAPGVLVPREETELLGWTALEVLNRAPAEAPRLIDMCCGSGNLACGIASKHPQVRAWALDLNENAVSATRANVQRLQLSNRVEVMESDLFASLISLGLEKTVDVIVCNPPYISSGQLDRHRAELLAHEPRAAFDGGPYGIGIFQRVVREAPLFLKPGGTLLFEIGVAQDRQVALLFDRTGCYEPVVAINDREGKARVIAGRKRAHIPDKNLV